MRTPLLLLLRCNSIAPACAVPGRTGPGRGGWGVVAILILQGHILNIAGALP